MITALKFRDAILSGSNNLSNRKEEIDRLNVFPVPDGDTGTNMSMTLSAGAKALEEYEIMEETTIAEISAVLAGALLRGARGNSGVILSLLFQGFSDGCKGRKSLTGAQFTKALLQGVDKAYKTVLKPTEGTILTVSRMAAIAADLAAKSGAKEEEIINTAFKEGDKALKKTPDMLPLLKKAGVVDAGGQGYVAIFEGILYYMRTKKIIPLKKPEENVTKSVVDPEIQSEEEITFTYCTEFLIDKNAEKHGDVLREKIREMGDSLIVVDTETLIKVHIHTDHPGKVMEEALLFGSLETVKIENMRLQFRNRQKKEKKKVSAPSPVVSPVEEAAFVAVCAGDGLADCFRDLGCSRVICGGQTMNPSAQDILSACLATPAKNVFILPNNSNIVMAANQAASLATDRTLHVIPTKTVPQGVSAAIAFDPTLSTDKIAESMQLAVENVRTGSITRAARESDFENKHIKEGQILAMEEGRLSFVHSDLAEATVTLAEKICDEDTSFLTLFCGADAKKEETERILSRLSEGHPDIEIQLLRGDQPVYPYLISAEK